MQHVQVATVPLNGNAPRQTEPKAPAALFSGESGAKDRAPHLGRHALAVVFNVHYHLVSDAVGANLDSPLLVGKRIDGVANKVLEDPAQQHGLVAHLGQCGRHIVAQLHPFGQALLKVADTVLDQRGEVGHLSGLVGTNF